MNPLSIIVTKGFGTGRTEISAFDNALQKAGVANYNLIILSSVIPSGATVKIGEPSLNHYSADEHGRRLYVVIAKQLQSELGLGAFAGLGWVQSSKKSDPQHFGRGLFVEHQGFSEQDVRTKIDQSLDDMVEQRPEGKIYSRRHIIVHGGVVKNEGFGCAIVIAAYQTSQW